MNTNELIDQIERIKKLMNQIEEIKDIACIISVFSTNDNSIFYANEILDIIDNIEDE